MVVANSSYSAGFNELIHYEIGINLGALQLRYSLLHWVNDGLMAVFFLYVGLEIKRAFGEGELSTFKRATLPVFAAMGGAAIPALIYYAINAGTTSASGWVFPWPQT